MFKLEKITKAFGGEQLFDELSFQIGKGEKCSLVGRNGSGKSTLLKILIGEIPPDSGKVIIPRHYRVGYLQQHIKFTMPTLREEAALALPEEERDIPYRVEAILSGLGFSIEDLDKPPGVFSGGFQLRIQLAKTLAQEPDCLLLDEPTNYLDVVSIRWLERFLRSWKGELVQISHDRTFLDAIATHTMGLHRKQLFRVQGTTTEYYNNLLQIEEVHEKTRVKLDKQKQHAEDFIRRFGAKASKAKQAQSRQKVLAKLPSLEKLAAIDNLDFHFRHAPFSGKTISQATDLEFKYPGMDEPLIEGLSFEIEPGDRIAIIGKNGRGKSTLLRLLAGDLAPDSGTIKRSDHLSVGFFGQTNVAKLNLSLTIEQEISLSNPKLPMSEIKRICGIMMFSQKQAEKKIGILSGGERSRVLLGKILATPCNLLLLDEPTNHLDLESIEALLEAMESFEGSVVTVSHDEEILRRVADKLIVCRQDGQKVFEGDYDYFLEKQGWEDAPEPKPKAPKVERDLKKKRADIIQERSRALNPLKNKIDMLEALIKKNEAKLSALQTSLTQPNGDLGEAAKNIGTLQKETDAVYLELEKQYQLFEETKLPYDKALESADK